MTDGVISLREIAPMDAQTLYQLRMNPLSRPMFRDSNMVSRESHQSMIRRYFDSQSRDYWFMIEAERSAIGTIALYNFAEGGRACEWGRFVIEPESRRLGFGRRALALLLDYSRAVGIQELHCQVFAGNIACLRLCREFGFSQNAIHEHNGRDLIDLSADLTGHVSPGFNT